MCSGNSTHKAGGGFRETAVLLQGDVAILTRAFTALGNQAFVGQWGEELMSSETDQ